MLTIKNLSLAYGNHILFSNASLQLYKGQKVGFIGQNGSGKTSLFKLILGNLHAESGEAALPKNTSIAYVEQEISKLDETLQNYVLSAHPLIIDQHTDLPEYYQLPSKAQKILVNLGFSLSELSLPLSYFSGGYQMRANLAKALFIPSDLLLLDEPTNHLDIETVMWLEDWLKAYQGLALIISHDREFLDNVTSHTLALSNKTLSLYNGNYTTFEKTKYLQLQQQEAQQTKNAAKAAHLQKFINRFSAGTKAKQAQSKAKMLAKIEIAAAMPKDNEFNVQFFDPEYTVNKLISVDNANIGYTDKLLLKAVKLDIFCDSQIGLLGKNGMGKSTLIKALIDKSTLLHGNIEINNKIKIGYFAQNSIDQLDADVSILDYLRLEHKDKKEQDLRNFIGGYGFNGDKIKQKIGVLSGGEKARLAIASIIFAKPNILFLDEPTNHLDIQMREQLASGIDEFSGSVIIVSHDSFLLQSIANEFYLIDNQELKPFAGDLDDYHQFLLSKQSAETNTPNDNIAKGSPTKNKNLVRLKNDIQKIEQKIAKSNQIIAEHEKLLANPQLQNTYDASALLKLNQEYANAKDKLAILENEWLRLQQELE